jgi:hypothetical protein
LEVINAEHNHEASLDMSGHPYARRLDQESRARVQEMSLAGIRPRDIANALRQSNPEQPIISKTVYNARDQVRRENLDGRTPIQALFDELKDGDFEYDYKQNQDGQLTHLFFAHPTSILLTRKYSSVLLMDCTYKTNKFRMPLLNVVGLTCFNTTFFACFIFLKNEKKEDYEWALTCVARLFVDSERPKVIVTDRELALINAVEVKFPEAHHLLCAWHIGMNVLAKCKRHFAAEEEWVAFLKQWIATVMSRTEHEFHGRLEELCSIYSNKPDVILYLQDTWVPFKEKFVAAWTNKYLHLGSTATSRVEGAHAMLKGYL